MMLNFLDVDSFIKDLKPVTSTSIFSSGEEFDPNGLFSELIFGPLESAERRTNFSYIDLNTSVIHPMGLKLILRLSSKVEKYLNTDKYFKIINGKLIESDEADGGLTGLDAFMENFHLIKFELNTPVRNKIFKFLSKMYNDNKLFISKIPVIPPDFRPAFEMEDGKWIIDGLNDLYIDILKKADQLRGVPKANPLYDILKWNLQKSVLKQFEYIKKKIEKKSGLIRGQLMGKRVDFTARAVISPNPNLKVSEIGVPLRIAVKLFEPLIIHQLIYSGNFDKKQLSLELKKNINQGVSIEAVRVVLDKIRNHDYISDGLYKIIKDAAEIAMRDRVVLAKRDPVLHPYSYQAYHPVLVDGDTIQISPPHVGGHNADFDGDQMVLFHPLTDEAQKEVKEKMFKYKLTTSGDLNIGLSKEIFLGLFFMTKEVPLKKSPIAVNENDIKNATDPFIPVKFKKQTMTMGRAIFNYCLPNDYPVINKQVNKKVVNSIINDIANKYGDEQLKRTMTLLEQFGFKFATLAGSSITLDDLDLPKEVYELKKKIKGASVEDAEKYIKQAEKIVKEYLKDTGFWEIVESGSAKGWGQPIQILVAKGIIADPSGKVLEPIPGSFSEGLSPTEFFKAASGARKGVQDRVINTADTGYYSRILVYVLATVELDPFLRDCKTKRTLNIRLEKDNINRLNGRYILNNGKVEKFDKSKFKIGDTINLRSPIFCESPKLCHVCYGDFALVHKTPYVGILAGQVLGEQMTQTIMRCSDGLIHYRNQLYPFEYFFNEFDRETNKSIENDIEIIHTKSQAVDGMNGRVETFSIQRHKPHDNVFLIRLKNGNHFLCQGNHPIFVKKNRLFEDDENRNIKLIDDNRYRNNSNLKRSINDYSLDVKSAQDLELYKDVIWIDNRIILNRKLNIQPDIDGYDLGVNFFDLDPDSRFIIQSKDFSNIRYLKPTYINFDNNWLRNFMAGFFDKYGTVINRLYTEFIYTTDNYYLISQLHSIAMKLNYQSDVNVKNSEKGIFSIIVRAHQDPPPTRKNIEFIPYLYKPSYPIRGFDLVVGKEMVNYKYYLYDVKTSTQDYLLNMCQNHNTFHTGGRVELIQRDILSDIINNDPLADLEI